MKNLPPFNTGEQILSYFEFRKWKKAKSLFTLPKFLDNIFTGIASISFTLGSGVLIATVLMGLILGFSEVSFYWSFYALTPVILFISISILTDFVIDIISLKYKKFMMQKMNEDLLKKFVHTLLTDSYSSHEMKNFSHYDSLILANHNDKRKMVELAYKCMEEFDYSYNRKVVDEKKSQLKKEKEAIIEKFRKDTIDHENSIEKFQFMSQ